MSIPNKNVDDPSKANLKSEMKYSVPIDRPRGALTRKELPLIVLLALLIGVWVWAISAWTSDIPMSGWIPLGFGGVSMLMVAVGLISWMSYSNRRGYDEEALRLPM